MPEPLRLSEIAGRPVHLADGSRAGRVADLEVDAAGGHARVRALRLRGRDRTADAVPWSGVAALSRSRVVLGDGAGEPGSTAEALWLVRDVLDAQIVDLAGRRVVRVGDVLLAPRDGALEVAGVEVGFAPVLRRLGLPRRLGRGAGTAIAWNDLHVVPKRGSRLELAVPRERLHAMAPAELAAVLARLAPPSAAAVAEAIEPSVVAGAVAAGHPSAGAAIVRSLHPRRAGQVVERMRADDAVSTLRHLGDDTLERVLGGVSTARAAELRRLLDYPATTAGGLMSIDHRIASVGEGAASILARLAERPPAVDGLLTIFVTDDAGRLVGTVPPRRLLAGRTDPLPLPALSVDTPLREVVDAFAVHDVLALPVLDQEGQVVGAVAVDDVLEELLVERLPGRRRFPLRLLRRRGRH
jgi:CBS domain-containing protein